MPSHMPNRTLYLRLEIEAPADTDPMLSLSDAATWAECLLNHAVEGGESINTRVTAYSAAEDIVLDEAEGKQGKRP